jgi:hypothetical protein
MTERRVPSLALVLSITAAAWGAQAAPLDLKRVMLSSGGVGYFEYEATVSGDDTLSLEVRLDQVDDVLKSLVIYDTAGSVTSISLQSREPLAQALRDLPFDAHALDTPKALFNALQGAELKIGNPRPMSGRILKAEDETTTIRDGQTITRTRVSLMTATGLQQFVLEDADAVGFVDPALQAKLADALATIARQRDGGRRTLTLQTHGGANRTVRVGYMVGAPLWKASYRLTFDANRAADKARLQGWAVLENTTAQDWQNVELTLLSGNPVTFRQALYQSYYVNRPEVPVEVIGHVLPKLDEGSVALVARSRQSDIQRQGSAAAPMAAPAPVMRGPTPGPREDFAGAGAAMAPASGAETSEGGTQVAFKLATKLSIAAGRSAVVPLLDRALPATRLSVLQADAREPYAAFQLTNDSPSGLPPGVLTLYERAADGAIAYVGDARLATFPIGEQRLLSYAIDSKLRVDRSTGTVSPITAATLSAGVLHVTRAMRQTTTYRLSAPTQDPRKVVIEQHRLSGWKLVQPDPGTIQMTPSAYRIPTELQPGEQKTVAVTLELPRQEEIRVLTADDAQLGAFATAPELAPKLHDALGEIARQRQALAAQRNTLQRLEAERDDLAKDQARVRDNLGAVSKGIPLYNRLIDKLAAEETRLDALAQSMAAANAEIDKATATLTDYVDKLTL